MGVLFNILGSTFLISLIAFAGAITLAMQKKLLDKIVFFLVAFSAGALMGGAFLHLLPEAVKSGIDIFSATLVGFLAFFAIEKFLRWRHCHKGKCDIHTFGYMNLVGDAIHNFTDGLVIAASFLASFPLGVASSLAIAFHEVPQEIGDFGVLVYSGISIKKALALNFLAAITVVLGGFAGFMLSEYIASFVDYLLPLAAGGFIYVAASDLIPEIRKTESAKDSAVTMATFVLGLLVMYAAKLLFL